MKTNQRRILLLLIGTLLIALYFINNTYILNFFDDQYPFLIKRYYNILVHQIGNPQYNFTDIQESPRIISLVFFLIIINLGHTLFITIWFKNKKAGIVFLIHLFAICVMVIIIYTIHVLLPEFEKFYVMARIIKDYTMSPIALVLFILLWKIYSFSEFQKTTIKRED